MPPQLPAENLRRPHFYHLVCFLINSMLMSFFFFLFGGEKSNVQLAYILAYHHHLRLLLKTCVYKYNLFIKFDSYALQRQEKVKR